MPRPSQNPLPPGAETQAVNVNFRMRERDRRDLKIWCAANDVTMTDAFVDGANLLRELRDRFGPEPTASLVELISAAQVFLIDRDRDLRVERRGADTWAVCKGGTVVNRDGEREYEPMPSSRDEDFIARTRYPLAEALRVAREYAGRAE